MEKKKILLPRKKFYTATDEDINLRLSLDESQVLLREGERNIMLDVNEQFNTERNDSVKYKIYGKIKMVFRNLYSGTTSYEPLAKNLYLVDDLNGCVPYNEFAFLRNDVLREKNQIVTGTTLGDYTPNLTYEGYTGHTSTTSIEAPYKNWNFYLSYVDGQDEDYPMTYTLSGDTSGETTFNFVASDGIPFRVEYIRNVFKLTSPIEHGMIVGEYVIIGDTPFYITSVGDETYNSEKYVINIIETDVPIEMVFELVVFGKRCVDIDDRLRTTSKYYVHKHKTLTGPTDYIMDKIGFESTIWKDERKILFENLLGENDVIVERNRMESLLFDFKEPLHLTGITNNLGYTPTEVYVTVIFRNGNGYFNYPPKVGYKFNFHNDWIDNHFSGDTSLESGLTSTEITTNTSGETFFGGDTLEIGSQLVGGFVEYNESELRERIISNTFHKIIVRQDIFNHNQDEEVYGSSPQNQIGLFYQPHYKVELRQLSPYIETSETDEVTNLPENSKYFPDEGTWKWRDLYDHGFIDVEGNGLNHPFINGTHYVKNEINFYLRNEKYYRNKEDGLNEFKGIKC
jgi:hypothetical protein